MDLFHDTITVEREREKSFKAYRDTNLTFVEPPTMFFLAELPLSLGLDIGFSMSFPQKGFEAPQKRQ